MKYFFFIVVILISSFSNGNQLGKPPVEAFAKLPEFSQPEISPSGNFLASQVVSQGKPVLLIQGFTPEGKKQQSPVAIPFNGLHLSRVIWGNDDYLIAFVRMAVERSYVGMINIKRPMIIARKDGKIIDIAMDANNKGRYLSFPWLVDVLEHDDDHVLMALDLVDMPKGYSVRDKSLKYASVPKLHKVNLATGKRELFSVNRMNFKRVLVDKKGNLRVGMRLAAGDSNLVKTFYRQSPESDWEVLQKTQYFDKKLYFPYAMSAEDDNILVLSSRDLSDDSNDPSERDLFAYDLTDHKVLGPYEHSVHARAKKLVKQAMPNFRTKLVSHTRDNQEYIFKMYSDIQAPDYYYFDLKSKSLSFFASEYPQLRDVPLAKMESIEYSARDGLNIPAYITYPLQSDVKSNDKKALPPLIVYPHGGPWARDHWGFDNYVQFFANRGYAVFQPQFRGSTGLGYEHQKAGFKQWGYAIQDDITDGVKYLIAEGKVDPNRVCIIGASFGGYAAAMGLIRTPELYRCGVSINGVLNFKELYHSMAYYLYSGINRELTNSKWGIEKASPYHLAKQIEDPLLLIAGDKDTVVPPKHSKKMFKKLKKLKHKVSYLELPEGEHWRTIEPNEITKLSEIEAFLKTHLK